MCRRSFLDSISGTGLRALVTLNARSARAGSSGLDPLLQVVQLRLRTEGDAWREAGVLAADRRRVDASRADPGRTRHHGGRRRKRVREDPPSRRTQDRTYRQGRAAAGLLPFIDAVLREIG